MSGEHEFQQIINKGNKQLELWVDLDMAGTYISNIDGLNSEPGSTTEIYQTVFNILKEYSASHNRPIRYTFRTNNLNMAEWARTSGNEIFNWNKTIENNPYYSFVAIKDFKPILK